MIEKLKLLKILQACKHFPEDEEDPEQSFTDEEANHDVENYLHEFMGHKILMDKLNEVIDKLNELENPE